MTAPGWRPNIYDQIPVPTRRPLANLTVSCCQNGATISPTLHNPRNESTRDKGKRTNKPSLRLPLVHSTESILYWALRHRFYLLQFSRPPDMAGWLRDRRPPPFGGFPGLPLLRAHVRLADVLPSTVGAHDLSMSACLASGSQTLTMGRLCWSVRCSPAAGIVHAQRASREECVEMCPHPLQRSHTTFDLVSPNFSTS